jgi:hypothetical protein
MSKERGTRVIVKTHGGRYVFARIWAVFPWAIELTADPHFRHLLRRRIAPRPIPFPPEDVYIDNQGARAAIEAGKSPESATLRRYERTT